MRHISLLILLAVTMSAAHYASSPTRRVLSCECWTYSNTFPMNVPGGGGINQGALTESMSCVVETTLQLCTAAGNVVWTPSVSCYPTGEWSNQYSFSIDLNCISNSAAFSNCSTSTSNFHSCSASCPPTSYFQLRALGYVKDSGASNLGFAEKLFRCGSS